MASLINSSLRLAAILICARERRPGRAVGARRRVCDRRTPHKGCGAKSQSSHPALQVPRGHPVMVKPALTLLLASPRGFCAGVERAIRIVERSLELYGAPVYVRHEIVHNRDVVEALEAKGAIFVEELEEVPP